MRIATEILTRDGKVVKTYGETKVEGATPAIQVAKVVADFMRQYDPTAVVYDTDEYGFELTGKTHTLFVSFE